MLYLWKPKVFCKIISQAFSILYHNYFASRESALKQIALKSPKSPMISSTVLIYTFGMQMIITSRQNQKVRSFICSPFAYYTQVDPEGSALNSK